MKRGRKQGSIEDAFTDFKKDQGQHLISFKDKEDRCTPDRESNNSAVDMNQVVRVNSSRGDSKRNYEDELRGRGAEFCTFQPDTQ